MQFTSLIRTETQTAEVSILKLRLHGTYDSVDQYYNDIMNNAVKNNWLLSILLMWDYLLILTFLYQYLILIDFKYCKAD